MVGEGRSSALGGLDLGDVVAERARRGLVQAAGAGGVAEGVLVGGNLTVLAATVGTSGARAARGGIAVLEDVSESPYRLDRALTQLVRSGWFDGVRGVADRLNALVPLAQEHGVVGEHETQRHALSLAGRRSAAGQ